MNKLKPTDDNTTATRSSSQSLVEMAQAQMAEREAKNERNERIREERLKAELEKLMEGIGECATTPSSTEPTAPHTQSNVVPIYRNVKPSLNSNQPAAALTKSISETPPSSTLANPLSTKTAYDKPMPEADAASPTVSINSRKHSKPATDRYAFPVPKNLEQPEDYDAVTKLNELVKKHPTPEEYPSIREEFCRLYLVLNNEKLLAPRFRAYIVNPPTASKAIRDLIQRDRIVLECNWLHSRGEHVVLDDDELEGLFDLDKPFDFVLAEKFAMKPYKNLIRAEEFLSLTPNVQIQLRAMCGQEMTEKLKAYDESSRRSGATVRISPKAQDRQAINRWCEKKPIIKRHFAKHQANAKAQALLSSGYSSLKEIAELSGLMRGVKPEDEKNLKNNLKSFNKYKQEIESGCSDGMQATR